MTRRDAVSHNIAMVTWGSNTTTVFGAGNSPASGFSFGGGGTPSTPPAASTPAPTNPPPLWGGATTSTTTAWGQPAASGGLFGSSTPGEIGN